MSFNIFMSDKGGAGKSSMILLFLYYISKFFDSLSNVNIINVIDFSGKNLDLMRSLSNIETINSSEGRIFTIKGNSNITVGSFEIFGDEQKEWPVIRVIYPSNAPSSLKIVNPFCFVDVLSEIHRLEELRADLSLVETPISIEHLLVEEQEFADYSRAPCPHSNNLQIDDAIINDLYDNFFLRIKKRIFWIFTERMISSLLSQGSGPTGFSALRRFFHCSGGDRQRREDLNRLVFVLNYYTLATRGGLGIHRRPGEDKIGRFPIKEEINNSRDGNCDIINFLMGSMGLTEVRESFLKSSEKSLKDLLETLIRKVFLEQNKSRISLRHVIYSNVHTPEIANLLPNILGREETRTLHADLVGLVESAVGRRINDVVKGIFYKFEGRDFV